jgi:hypothetical protein
MYGSGSDPAAGGGGLAAVGLGGTVATAGSLAYTGIEAIGLAIFAATLVFTGLVLVRLAAVRRTRVAAATVSGSGTGRHHRKPGLD